MTEASSELKNEIKAMIVSTLNLSDVKPEDIREDASLFEGGNTLELDSVDALEIVMALQRKYGVKLDDQNTSRYVLRSVDTISEFVAKNRTK